MWMLEVDPTVFSYYGKNYPIKDMKDIEEYTNFINLDINNESTLDEICVRPDVYGENTEDYSYKLFEANVVALMDNDFDMTKIKSLRIPLQ
jgi:hypothetical protein